MEYIWQCALESGLNLGCNGDFFRNVNATQMLLYSE